MAQQLKPHGITAIALAPDWTNTESMEPTEEDLLSMESVELGGRVVKALAADPQIHKKTGLLLRTRALAQEYSLFDIDGRQPEPDTYKTFKI